MRVGIVSYTDPRKTALAREREQYIEKSHYQLHEFLRAHHIEVVDPLVQMREGWKSTFGIATNAENKQCLKALISSEVEALIICIWHWTEPQLVVWLARELNRPVALYTNQDPAWAGSVGITAAGASLWEHAATHYVRTHQRFMDEPNELLRWLRGVTAFQRMRQGSILLWGGSYCLRMEHLQDDIPKLKSFLVNDILTEGQYVIIKRAEEILESDSKRVAKFRTWLEQHGVAIQFDRKMLTAPVLDKQLAFYLAARDRLNELSDLNVLGVSVKCQPEFSVEYGVTACTLPAFLPFASDASGLQPIVPTVCEGDIKGLLTAVLFHQIQPEVPPLFGDLTFVSDEYLTLSNCGASSVFYAANSLEPKTALSKVVISPQCQGASGGAIGYDGKASDMTLGRLIRIDGRYIMHVANGRAITFSAPMKKKTIWGQSWPHVAIHLKTDAHRFIKQAGANHYIATLGHHAQEITYACEAAGIHVQDMTAY
jgi:L-fucose isomerase